MNHPRRADPVRTGMRLPKVGKGQRQTSSQRRNGNPDNGGGRRIGGNNHLCFLQTGYRYPADRLSGREMPELRLKAVHGTKNPRTQLHRCLDHL